ncbi:MAG: hypothetical protein BGP08_01430 [Rhizobiales bacterium 64-17]|nr:MAG: hypothetical protein BGP08_01430 [Rhizobiales bacterium 64-17]
MIPGAFHQKYQVETKEPLETTASIFEFNFFWSTFIAYPNAKMITISLKLKCIISLFPPISEFFS